MPNLSQLDLDVWARIATFLPRAQRIPAFWALRRALVLPTEHSVYHTMMRFLNEAARQDYAQAVAEDGDWWPTLPTWTDECQELLESMGFEAQRVVNALISVNGDCTLALHVLLVGGQ